MRRRNFLLVPKDDRQLTRKQRRYLKLAISIVAVGIVGILLARPVRNSVRSWQARRHADRAFALIEQKKWPEARDEATTAYRLQPNEPEAVRAVARLLSRAGRAEGLEFWTRLASVRRLTRDDLREEATLAIQVNDLGAARNAVQALMKDPTTPPAPGDLLLAAEVASGQKHRSEAKDLLKRLLADPKSSRAEQLRAVLLLERNGPSSETGEIFKRLAELAKGTDEASLEALTALAVRLTASPGNSKLSPIPPDEIANDIDRHSLAKISHRLVAADLQIARHPDQKNEILDQNIHRWKNSNDEDVAVLTTWLFHHGEYQRIIDTVPLNRALHTRELFLQYVDTLEALGNWDDARKILESERFPLDPVIQSMYVAQCYMQLGQQKGADNNWQRAVENAAGDVNKLVMLGAFAQKTGAHEIARTAYEAAVAISPKSREAQLGRLRTIYQSRDTRKIHATLVELLKMWPTDVALENDEAYTRLLLMDSAQTEDRGQKTENSWSPTTTKTLNSQRSTLNSASDNPELTAIERRAEQLLKEDPSSIPHRTVLALALLMENRPYTAYALYKDVVVPQTAISPSVIVVHAAVLSAVGQKKDAGIELQKIRLDNLLPEERALLLAAK